MNHFIFPKWSSPLSGQVGELFLSLPGRDFPFAGTPDPLLFTRARLMKTRTILSTLRSLIEPHDFESEKEEIAFFKQIKPLFSANAVFWSRLFDLQLHLPVGSGGMVRKYWKEELKSYTRFYAQHSGFYEYVRTGDDRLDEIYFLRRNRDREEISVSTDWNPRYTTARDPLLGKIFGYEMLGQYIGQVLHGAAQPAPASPLQWTASKAGLVELIYALQSGGVYNNGQSEIKEIAEAFQRLFRVDLGNYYHVFNEIRLRKKNRTSLLDQLREKVLGKMDALDER